MRSYVVAHVPFPGASHAEDILRHSLDFEHGLSRMRRLIQVSAAESGANPKIRCWLRCELSTAAKPPNGFGQAGEPCVRSSDSIPWHGSLNNETYGGTWCSPRDCFILITSGIFDKLLSLMTLIIQVPLSEMPRRIVLNKTRPKPPKLRAGRVK